jgi:hypothetical protein
MHRCWLRSPFGPIQANPCQLTSQRRQVPKLHFIVPTAEGENFSAGMKHDIANRSFAGRFQNSDGAPRFEIDEMNRAISLRVAMNGAAGARRSIQPELCQDLAQAL